MQIQICDDFAKKKKTIKTMNYKGSVSVLIYISFFIFLCTNAQLFRFRFARSMPIEKVPSCPIMNCIESANALAPDRGNVDRLSLGRWWLRTLFEFEDKGKGCRGQFRKFRRQIARSRCLQVRERMRAFSMSSLHMSKRHVSSRLNIVIHDCCICINESIIECLSRFKIN